MSVTEGTGNPPRRSTKPSRSVITDNERTVPTQGELAGFEQKRVAKIETWAAKADDTRAAINGLKEELANREFKLREAMHENADLVDKQSSEDGDQLLVYKRGDFNITVKRGKETVNYKVGEKSKGDEPIEDVE